MSRVVIVARTRMRGVHLPWVGIQAAPPGIAEGSLVRVSLTRLLGADTVPEGYYVQISGVLH